MELRTTDRSRGAWLRRIATLALLVALVSPAVRNRDGLPLSTYPMYSTARSEVSSFITASGTDADGAAQRLSALVISESRDRLIAQSFLNDAVRRGAVDDVCAEIAARAGSTVVAVEIAIEQHGTIDRLRNDESLRSREVLASCPVPS